jgi:hypothetical protein
MRYARHWLTLAMVVVAGCGGDSTGPTGPQGTYRLERVNGGSLPFLAEQFGDFRIDIVSGSLIVRADHTFSAEITSQQTNGSASQTIAEQAAGSWTSNGSAITFTEPGSAAYSGQLSGDRLTAQRAGVTFEFVKQ